MVICNSSGAPIEGICCFSGRALQLHSAVLFLPLPATTDCRTAEQASTACVVTRPAYWVASTTGQFLTLLLLLLLLLLLNALAIATGLPQILFGRSVADLSALEAAQLAASLAALSGRASLDLVDAARAAAGLDRFNVRQDEDGGFLVAGGVYLTRDVYVEVARTGLGEAQSTVEWTIRPRLVLITSFLSSGDQRVSLRWRRETD